MVEDYSMPSEDKCVRCGKVIGEHPHYRAGKGMYAHSGVCPSKTINYNCSLCGKPVNGFTYRQERNGAVYHFNCDNPQTTREVLGVGKKSEFVMSIEKNICERCGKNIIFGQQFKSIDGQCTHMGQCATGNSK